MKKGTVEPDERWCLRDMQVERAGRYRAFTSLDLFFLFPSPLSFVFSFLFSPEIGVIREASDEFESPSSHYLRDDLLNGSHVVKLFDWIQRDCNRG